MVKNLEALKISIEPEKNLVFLDQRGKMLDSRAFSTFLFSFPSRISFVIGGKEGLPSHLLNGKQVISFSPMTLTHQMIRLFLIEQIYRGFEIHKGSDYHH